MPTTRHSVPAQELPASKPVDAQDARTGLNERQRELLELISRKGRATSREYCEAAGLSRRTALRDLQELMQRGLIVREGSRKAAVYRLR